MVARHYYRYVSGDPVEEVPNVLRWGYNGAQQAEEGQAPTYEIIVDDPDMTMDFVGHRRWIVYEDQSDDPNEVILDGLVQAVKIAHKGGDITQPLGRVWTIEVADLNTLWTYRVMTGSDSQFPEQTDVERMQQLVDSEEMGYFDDLSLLASGSPVTLDKLNGRGMSTGQIADTCAQETGKNWYIYSTGSRAAGADIGVWYGRDSLTSYQSPLSLSNDPADLDMPAVNAGTATTYPIGADTVLRRDYARQYSGAYGEFQDGAKYVVNTATLAEITLGGRDMTHPAPEIKTRERMKRRLTRQLADHASPEHVISTTVTLPANKVSQCRVGMRIFFTATHEPGYEEGKYLRIMTATLTPIGNRYTVALELSGPGAAAVAPASCSTVIAAGEVSVATGLASTSLSVGITPANSTVLIAWLIGNDGNTPPATNMTAISGGYTELLNESAFSRSTYRIGAKAATGGVLSTAAATFTAGFSPAHNIWLAVQVALELGSASPVQSKYDDASFTATLDAPPTAGNIVLVFAFGDSGTSAIGPNTNATLGPTTGWTELLNRLHRYPNSGFVCAVYARCVGSGETGEYAFAPTGGYTTGKAIFIAEFTP